MLVSQHFIYVPDTVERTDIHKMGEWVVDVITETYSM